MPFSKKLFPLKLKGQIKNHYNYFRGYIKYLIKKKVIIKRWFPQYMPVHSWSEYSFTKRVGYEEAIKKKNCPQGSVNRSQKIMFWPTENYFSFSVTIFPFPITLFRIFNSRLFLIMGSFFSPFFSDKTC